MRTIKTEILRWYTSVFISSKLRHKYRASLIERQLHVLASDPLMTSCDVSRTATAITEHCIAEIIYTRSHRATITRALSRLLYFLIKTPACTIRMI